MTVCRGGGFINANVVPLSPTTTISPGLPMIHGCALDPVAAGAETDGRSALDFIVASFVADTIDGVRSTALAPPLSVAHNAVDVEQFTLGD